MTDDERAQLLKMAFELAEGWDVRLGRPLQRLIFLRRMSALCEFAAAHPQISRLSRGIGTNADRIFMYDEALRLRDAARPGLESAPARQADGLRRPSGG